MDKLNRKLARIAGNIMSAADSTEHTEVKLALYLVAGEIGAEAMRPEEDMVGYCPDSIGISPAEQKRLFPAHPQDLFEEAG